MNERTLDGGSEPLAHEMPKLMGGQREEGKGKEVGKLDPLSSETRAGLKASKRLSLALRLNIELGQVQVHGLVWPSIEISLRDLESPREENWNWNQLESIFSGYFSQLSVLIRRRRVSEIHSQMEWIWIRSLEFEFSKTVWSLLLFAVV